MRENFHWLCLVPTGLENKYFRGAVVLNKATILETLDSIMCTKGGWIVVLCGKF